VNCVLDASRCAHLVSDHLCDQLGVRGRAEDLPACLVFVSEFAGIHEVAIMGNGDDVITKKKIERLCVLRLVCSGRGIPYMPYSNIAFKPPQQCWIEDFGNKTLALVFIELNPIKSGDPCALLPPMLKSKQCIIE